MNSMRHGDNCQVLFNREKNLTKNCVVLGVLVARHDKLILFKCWGKSKEKIRFSFYSICCVNSYYMKQDSLLHCRYKEWN